MVPAIVLFNCLLAALLLFIAAQIRQLHRQVRDWRLGIAPLLRQTGPLLVTVPPDWPARIRDGHRSWDQLEQSRRQLGRLLLYVRLLRPLLPWLKLWTKR